jgi:hypothetical protein
MNWSVLMKQFTAIILSLMLGFSASHAFAESIGKIKTLSGDVFIERANATIPAELGSEVYQSDSVITHNGAVGILFHDDSRVSLGSNSEMSLESFAFDKNTHDGNLDVSVQKGTLSAISGKLTEKKPGAFKVKTPAAILAVRGTEFSVKVLEP